MKRIFSGVQIVLKVDVKIAYYHHPENVISVVTTKGSTDCYNRG